MAPSTDQRQYIEVIPTNVFAGIDDNVSIYSSTVFPGNLELSFM
jgi:hypothetical protein